MNPETDLTLERRFAAPPDKVWRALTEPDLIKQWFAPKPVETREVRMEVRPGGAYYTLMVLPDGTEMGSEGCILAAETARFLVFTDALRGGWRPNPEPFMTAELRLAPDGDGTLYSVRVMHNDEAARHKHEEMGFHEGWGTAADQLGALVETL
jgi:uncharacterized protein YndB with AHSA1/START domain